MHRFINYYLISIFFIGVFTANVYSQEAKQGARLKFEKEIELLDTLYVNELEPQNLEIEFENEGDEPLVLSYVRGCCGTRIKSWTKEPIMPGEKGEIEVEFRVAPRPHRISRTVSVMSNDADGMKVFRIRGQVVDSEEEEPFGTKAGNSGTPNVR